MSGRGPRIVPMLFVASLASLTLLLGSVGSGEEKFKRVKALDDCEAISFNTALGFVACQGDGKTTFDRFIKQLMRHGDAHKWRFEPDRFDLPRGKTIKLENLGGEDHTWTEVAQFGGGYGFFPFLDPSVNPECDPNNPGPNNVDLEYLDVEDGATAGSADLPQGMHKFECCVHPWMHAIVKVNK